MAKKKPRKLVAQPSAGSRKAPIQAPRSVFLSTLTVIVLVGAIVRVLSARGELWLDEIWSFRLAQFLDGPAGVLTGLHHDNNHHLNSVYLFFVNESPFWIRYRLHTLAAGIGTMILACFIARREADQSTTVAVGLLISGSFLLTLYASEARGYALAVFFAFLAVPLAGRFLETGRLRWAAGYVATSVLGLLSHLTFLHAMLGLVTWTAYRAVRRPHPRSTVSRLVLLHAAPLAALAALYWIDLRHVILGGGPVHPAGDMIASVASLVVGGPEQGGLRGAAALASGIASIAAIVAVRRTGSDLWILFAVAGIAAPVLTLALTPGPLLFERYFVVSSAFVTLSYGWLLAAVARRSLWIAAVLTMAYLLPNGARIQRLIESGRGSYMAALQHIIERSTQRPVTIGGDHDFRQGRLVEFYSGFVERGSDIEYHTPPEWAAAGPEWMLTHSQAADFTPPPEIAFSSGRRYRLSSVYPYAGVSGWYLAVYHNALAAR